MKTRLTLLIAAAAGLAALPTGVAVYQSYRTAQIEHAKGEFGRKLEALLSGAPSREQLSDLSQRARTLLADPAKVTQETIDQLRQLSEDAASKGRAAREVLARIEEAKRDIAQRYHILASDELVSYLQAQRIEELKRVADGFERFASDVRDQMIPVAEQALQNQAKGENLAQASSPQEPAQQENVPRSFSTTQRFHSRRGGSFGAVSSGFYPDVGLTGSVGTIVSDYAPVGDWYDYGDYDYDYDYDVGYDLGYYSYDDYPYVYAPSVFVGVSPWWPWWSWSWPGWWWPGWGVSVGWWPGISISFGWWTGPGWWGCWRPWWCGGWPWWTGPGWWGWHGFWGGDPWWGWHGPWAGWSRWGGWNGWGNRWAGFLGNRWVGNNFVGFNRITNNLTVNRFGAGSVFQRGFGNRFVGNSLVDPARGLQTTRLNSAQGVLGSGQGFRQGFLPGGGRVGNNLVSNTNAAARTGAWRQSLPGSATPTAQRSALGGAMGLRGASTFRFSDPRGFSGQGRTPGQLSGNRFSFSSPSNVQGFRSHGVPSGAWQGGVTSRGFHFNSAPSLGGFRGGGVRQFAPRSFQRLGHPGIPSAGGFRSFGGMRSFSRGPAFGGFPRGGGWLGGGLSHGGFGGFHGGGFRGGGFRGGAGGFRGFHR
jgi:hypothetical protein